MISYAGVELLCLTDTVRQWIEGQMDPTWVWEFAYAPVGAPPPPQTPQRPIELDRLYWPTGASRWAVGHFLVSAGMLQQIREAVNPSKSSFLPADLVFRDGTLGTTLTVSLYMLPARPLQQIGQEGLYLLTLVDERWLLHARAANIEVEAGVTTWDGLYALIASALGIALTIDPIPSAYLEPPESLTNRHDPHLPVYLDQVAQLVGQRIVRQMGGGWRAWNADTSRTQLTANLEAMGYRLSGGTFSLGQEGEDNAAALPATWQVVLPRSDGAERHAESVALTALGVDQEINGVTGKGTRALAHPIVAEYTSGAITNGADITALASQIAADESLWIVGGVLDLRLPGYPEWTIDGGVDCVILSHRSGDMSTRIIRGPWGRSGADALMQATATTTSSLIVQDTQPVPEVVIAHTLEVTSQNDLFQPLGFVLTEPDSGQARLALKYRPLQEGNFDADAYPTAHWDVTAGELRGITFSGNSAGPISYNMVAHIGVGSYENPIYQGMFMTVGETTGLYPGRTGLALMPFGVEYQRWMNGPSGFTTVYPYFTMSRKNGIGAVERIQGISQGAVTSIPIASIASIEVCSGHIISINETPDDPPPDPSGSLGTECDACEGASPSDWALSPASFSGQLDIFNGSWTATQSSDPCQWTTSDADAIVTVTMFDGVLYLTFTDNPPGNFSATYYAITDDCCTATLMFLLATPDGVGSAPDTITITPSGCA